MHVQLKFEFACAKLPPLASLRETLVRDKIFSVVTRVASLTNKGTQLKDTRFFKFPLRVD